jgi:CRISPR-associated endonuclease/helicase Cas3
LAGVASLAKQLAELTGVPDLPAAAEAAGWLHDLGKYQPEWQRYLKSSAAGLRPSTVPHSVYGAAFAFTTMEHCPISAIIAGHHSGLGDFFSDVQPLLDAGKKAPEDLVRALVSAAVADGCELPLSLPLPQCAGDDDGMRRLEFWTRILFSILIDADRLNTSGRSRRDRPLDPGHLLEVLRAKAPQPKVGASERLNELRRQVFEACVTAGSEPRGFFDLTVPTGGGKTRSSMAFALAHARKHNLRRVFVVIPYLSIIEQNAREYRELFGSDVVLEHHSAVVADDRPTKGEEYTSLSPCEVAAENWDAPVVVTTSVQFLETLLAANTRRCRRLHSVARSVILFDEAQCLPTHILDPLMEVFRELTTNYGCSIVFSTATQPAFRYCPTGLTNGLRDGELKSILPGDLRDNLYRDLKRVTYTNATTTTWDWDALVREMLNGPSLCVLNTRKHARAVWEKLQEKVEDKSSVRHLSSSLCPQHRLDILGKRTDEGTGSIYSRLNANQPCWVVSTQVIEAGVDISFPRVFRAIGPLDSIVQAAGRCNREGEWPSGSVTIFTPEDDAMPQGSYQMATGLALTTLSEVSADDLATNPAVFTKYFAELYGRLATDLTDIQKMRLDWKFEAVAQAATVITDTGRSVIVPYGRGKRLASKIRKLGRFDRRLLRALQRYTVNLREHDFQVARAAGLVTPLVRPFGSQAISEQIDEGPWVLSEGSYHDDLGVVLENRPLDDFLI